MKRKERTLTTAQMALTALMTAALCLMAPWAVMLPWSPVPVSLTNLVVYLAVYLLGGRLGTLSYLLYLLLGLVGLPVFSGFSGGVGKLLGLTGGYLIGMIFMALIFGGFLQRFSKGGRLDRLMQLLGMVLGSLVNYAFGTAWLAHMAGMSFSAALAAGVLPFIPGDLVKIFVVLLLGPILHRRLLRAGLVE